MIFEIFSFQVTGSWISGQLLTAFHRAFWVAFFGNLDEVIKPNHKKIAVSVVGQTLCPLKHHHRYAVLSLVRKAQMDTGYTVFAQDFRRPSMEP